MDIFLSVFQAVAIMFGIGIIGFAIIHRKMVDADIFALIIPIIVDVALPCLIFFNIISKFNTEKIIELWQFPAAWVLETIYFFILSVFFGKISNNNIRKEFTVSLFYQNGIFFPIIILSQIYGDNSSQLVYLFIFTVFYPTFFFNTYSFFFKKFSATNKKDILKEVVNLALIATIIALIFKITGTDAYLPDFIVKIFQKVGAVTIPLLMITIGGNIYLDLQKKKKFQLSENIKFVLVKNFIFPILTIFIIHFLKIKGNLALILFLESAVPPITAIPIFIGKAGGNSSIANQFLLSSFIISLFSIPVMFYLYQLIV